MSTTYIVIFPANPLLPVPDKNAVIEKLKEKQFLAAADFEWLNPQTSETELFYRAGEKYLDYFDVSDEEDAEQLTARAATEVIDYREHENIQPEFYTHGDFELYNPATGTDAGEAWAEILGAFLANNNSRWTDPADGKPYAIFELRSRNIALGKYFILLEEGIGNPNPALLELLEEITGQRHKWMRARI